MQLTRHLFLEGTDGSGKSTLYQTLLAIGLPGGYHAGGPPRNADDLLKRFVEPLYMNPCIIDRHSAISELVYRTAFEERLMVPSPIIYAWLRYTKPVIIYCRPSDRTIGQVNLEAKEHKPPEHVAKCLKHRTSLINVYDEIMRRLWSETTVIDYNWRLDPKAEDLIKRLKEEELCAD